MEKKTRAEILVSLYNEQLEVVINREASLRMLKKMDPRQVLTTKLDVGSMQPTTITAESRLKEMESAMVHDKARLEAFEEMMKEAEAA